MPSSFNGYVSDSGNDCVFLWVIFHPASDWGDRAGLNKSHQLGRLSLEDIPRSKIVRYHEGQNSYASLREVGHGSDLLYQATGKWSWRLYPKVI